MEGVSAVVLEIDDEVYGAVRHPEGHVNLAATGSLPRTLRTLAAVAEGEGG